MIKHLRIVLFSCALDADGVSGPALDVTVKLVVTCCSSETDSLALVHVMRNIFAYFQES